MILEVFYRRGLQINPRNVLVIDYLGNFYLFHKQLPEALEQFKRAYEVAPSDRNATFFLARGLFANAEYAAAEPYLEHLSRSTVLRPKRRAIVFLSLGQVELRLNRLTEAEAVLKQLENEDETYEGLHDTLGVIYQMEGKIPAEYVREFQVSGDPRSRQKAFDLARLLRSTPDGPSSSGLGAPKTVR